MYKKLGILTVLSTVLCMNTCFAKDLSKSIDTVITESGIKKGSVSISVKALETKKPVYELNINTPFSPASVQKLVTTLPALKTLGEDYNFETKLYKNTSDEYIIVLGADPYLKAKDLKALTKKMPQEVNSIYIDDSIVDEKEWGEGWQWDDDLNPLMPKFSAYNIDRNTINVIIQPTTQGAPANIMPEKQYPITFNNRVISGDTTSYTIDKKSLESIDIITINGTVKKTITTPIPVGNPKKYFKIRLTDALLDNEKCNSGVYLNKTLTNDYTFVDSIKHSIALAKVDILKNSDNFVAETLFKLAGGKFKNTTGSFEAGKEMFNNYCEKMNLDNSQINIVDASGVSKNNLMVADFMTNFLILNRSELEPIMATSGEGTLADRLLYLKGNLKAKTGTLSNISTLTGFVSSQNGHKYAFCIMINDAKSKSRDKKLLEDNIIKTIYLKG